MFGAGHRVSGMLVYAYMNWRLLIFFLACVMTIPFLLFNLWVDLWAGSLFAALLNVIAVCLVSHILVGIWDGTIDPRDS